MPFGFQSPPSFRPLESIKKNGLSSSFDIDTNRLTNQSVDYTIINKFKVVSQSALDSDSTIESQQTDEFD